MGCDAAGEEAAGLDLLVRVDEVGTEVEGTVDCLRAEVDERVVEVMMRSMCEARLSEEGFRGRSLFCTGVERERSGSDWWTGG